MRTDVKRKDNGLKIFATIISSFPLLAFRFFKLFLSFKKQSHRAGKIFKKELIRQGIDKNTAKKLTKVYAQPLNFKKLLS